MREQDEEGILNEFIDLYFNLYFFSIESIDFASVFEIYSKKRKNFIKKFIGDQRLITFLFEFSELNSHLTTARSLYYLCLNSTALQHWIEDRYRDLA